MKQNTVPVAIVGVGIAGLAAALTLQDAGIESALYEASNRVGGRMHSDAMTWADGLVSEWCGEFIDPNHTTLLQLIARFALPTIDLGSASQAAENIVYLAGRYMGVAELATAAAPLAPILHQHFQAAGYPTTYDHFTAEGARLDQISVAEWIAQYVAGGLASPLGHMLANACSGVYGMEPRDQSALNLVYLFGSDDPAQDLAVAKPMLGRQRIAGGNVCLPQAIAAALPPENLHLGHELVAIARETDGTVRLTFATETGTVEIACEHAILALPFSTLRRVDCRQAGFDALKQEAITQLGYGTVSKLMLQFDEAYWQSDGPWPHPNSGFIITDLGIQTQWDESIGQAGMRRILVNYTSGARGAAFAPTHAYATTADDASIARYAQACLVELEQVLPGITRHYTGTAALSYPTGDPHLLGSYACWRVGQYTRFAGYEGVPQGPIHFAGEHCSVAFQGYMEGAAQEGIRAAQEITGIESKDAVVSA